MATKCSHCGSKLLASKSVLTVNVDPKHAHEAPAGTYCITGDKNCFQDAVAAKTGVRSKRQTAVGG